MGLTQQAQQPSSATGKWNELCGMLKAAVADSYEFSQQIQQVSALGPSCLTMQRLNKDFVSIQQTIWTATELRNLMINLLAGIINFSITVSLSGQQTVCALAARKCITCTAAISKRLRHLIS